MKTQEMTMNEIQNLKESNYVIMGNINTLKYQLMVCQGMLTDAQSEQLVDRICELERSYKTNNELIAYYEKQLG